MKLLASFFFFALGTLYVDPVQSLKCQEGFNASISGIPFYHWNEQECMENSDCFEQEIQIQLPVYQIQGKSSMSANSPTLGLYTVPYVHVDVHIYQNLVHNRSHPRSNCHVMLGPGSGAITPTH